MGTRNNYDKEYKKNITEAAILAKGNGKSIAQIAKEYGIIADTLRNWIKEYEKNGKFVGSGNIKPENEEIYKLKKELAEAKEENAILKKAAAYFAKNQK